MNNQWQTSNDDFMDHETSSQSKQRSNPSWPSEKHQVFPEARDRDRDIDQDRDRGRSQ